MSHCAACSVWASAELISVGIWMCSPIEVCVIYTLTLNWAEMHALCGLTRCLEDSRSSRLRGGQWEKRPFSYCSSSIFAKGFLFIFSFLASIWFSLRGNDIEQGTYGTAQKYLSEYILDGFTHKRSFSVNLSLNVRLQWKNIFTTCTKQSLV